MDKDWTGNSGSALRIIGFNSDVEREANDYYATDPKAARWLIRLENLDQNIWECACGEGHLAKVFTDMLYTVKATDLIDRGYGVGGVNFLECTEPFNGDIVTNPPFKYAQQFIEKALELVPDGNKVCMFLKVQSLEGKSRRKLFDTQPPARVWVSTSRIRCFINGKDTGKDSAVAYAWYVWEKGYKGETTLKWFN